MKAKKKFLVSLRVPEGATEEDVRQYIKEAVRTWIGSKCPEHPLFDLDRKSVQVKHVVEVS